MIRTEQNNMLLEDAPTIESSDYAVNKGIIMASLGWRLFGKFDLDSSENNLVNEEEDLKIESDAYDMIRASNVKDN
jgi:hypothetical protein